MGIIKSYLKYYLELIIIVFFIILIFFVSYSFLSSKNKSIVIQSYKQGYIDGYNKALNDFDSEIKQLESIIKDLLEKEIQKNNDTDEIPERIA